MKLSYREKIVLLVVIVFLVVLVFVMWPIKAIRANIDQHEQQYETVKVDYDNNKKLISEIPVIEGNITKIYEGSKDLNKEFIVHKENFQIDQYIQEVMNAPEFIDGDKNKIEIMGDFKQEDIDTTPLEFYYYTPQVITYPILENADVNGDLLASTDKELYKKVINAVCMENLEPQSIERHVGGVYVKFTKDALYDFIDKLKELDTGMRVSLVEIDDYEFGNLTGITVEDAKLLEMEGYSLGQIDFEFFTMQEIQKPVFD